MSKHTETGDSLTLEDIRRAVDWLGSDEYTEQEADDYKASMQMMEANQRGLIVTAITGNLERLNKMKRWQLIARWKTMSWVMELLLLSGMFRSKPTHTQQDKENI